MRRSYMSGLLVLLLLTFLPSATTTAWAQSTTGTLIGQVEDVEHSSLYGAQVQLQPSSGTATTDEQGDFALNGLEPGSYTASVSYAGFETLTQKVVISAGQSTHLNAVLKIAGANEVVTVLAGRESGEAEGISRTAAADNIVQVLPAEVITSLPNANIADALGRLPSVTIERDEGEGKYVQIRGTEPRLSNVMVDGVTIPSPEAGVRQIKLDTIASDLVESVEINKTLQANIDGDGIGGSVNLVTKTAQEAPTMNLFGLGGYTPILADGRGVMQSGGTIGKRFGAQKRLGILVGATYDYNGRGINDIEPSPTPGSVVPHYDSMDLRDYQYDRTRWGAAGSVDYKLGEGSSLYLRSLFSTFRNWGHKWVFALNDNDLPKYSQDWRRPNMAVFNVVAGGKHVFSNSWLAWDVALGRSRAFEGGAGDGNAKYGWAGDQNINCFNDQSVATSVYRPGWSAGCFGQGGDNAMNANNYGLTSFKFNGQGQSAQLDLTGAASYARNYHLGKHFATFEFGAKIRNEHKYDNSYQQTIKFPTDPITGEPTILNSAHPEWASDFTDSNYYDGTYKYGTNLTDYSKVRDWVLANQGLGSLSTDYSNRFDYVERITAGYLMNTIDLSSRVRLVGGVRFENTYLSGLTFNTNDSSQVPTVPLTPATTLDVLPSASLRLGLDKASNLRIVYGRGVARPNPQDIMQALSYDDSASPTLVTLGNTKLKPEHADNFDLLYERYMHSLGLFQAGYFFKYLTDPIIQTTTDTAISPSPLIPATNPTYRVTQAGNAGSAHVQGFEIGFQQHLTYLPGVMRGLGIAANYSFTESTTDGLPGRSDHPALLRQAPHTWNISPTFDTRKFSMRLGMTYNGAMIYAYQWTDGADAVGPHGPAGDNYFYRHFQVDVQGSYKVAHGIQVYAYGLNLNNEVFGFYNGSPQYVVQREYYKPTYAGGVRYTFGAE